MLAGEQRGRNHDSHLHAIHGGKESGAQGHFRLAEADVAADKAVHRPAGREIIPHRLDGVQLVLGFVVGKRAANSS